MHERQFPGILGSEVIHEERVHVPHVRGRDKAHVSGLPESEVGRYEAAFEIGVVDGDDVCGERGREKEREKEGGEAHAGVVH